MEININFNIFCFEKYKLENSPFIASFVGSNTHKARIVLMLCLVYAVKK